MECDSMLIHPGTSDHKHPTLMQSLNSFQEGFKFDHSGHFVKRFVIWYLLSLYYIDPDSYWHDLQLSFTVKRVSLSLFVSVNCVHVYLHIDRLGHSRSLKTHLLHFLWTHWYKDIVLYVIRGRVTVIDMGSYCISVDIRPKPYITHMSFQGLITVFVMKSIEFDCISLTFTELQRIKLK